MTDTLTIPAIPANWVANTGIIPAGQGHRTHVHRVLRHLSDNDYTPWVIHTAYVTDDGTWAYSGGTYLRTKEAALVAFDKYR